MIALRHALPLVRSGHGNAVAFEGIWLRVALQDAAGRAGYDAWWPVDDLVTGISLYLRHGYIKNVIDVTELESIVRTVLRQIGYQEVAACFRAIPLSRGISLVRCLKDGPFAGSVSFFDQLARTIRLLCKEKVRHFHFYDLDACVDRLDTKTGSGRATQTEVTTGKIVKFVRECVYAQRWRQQVWCSIS